MPGVEPEKVLLVEGEDDQHVIEQLRRSIQLPDFSSQVTRDVSRLIDAIGPALIAPDRRALGILLDADDEPEAQWGKLRIRFSEENVSIPEHPDPDGTILLADNGVRIGIWMMPDNQSAGELEDFFEQMIPSGDAVWESAQRYIDAIPDEHRKFRPGKILRAKVYAWLATREVPGRMGAAIGRSDVEVNGPLPSRFAEWLRRLFA